MTFSLHPLRVEAVAWVSARGTVLGTLLLVLTVLAYLAGWQRRGPGATRLPSGWLAASLGCFAASLLARATGVVLPVVLLLLDVYPLRRLGGGPGRWFGPAARPVWVEKLGFAAVAAAAVPMAFVARGDSDRPFWQFEWDPPVALAWGVYGGAWYVWKTLWPTGLAAVYRMPTREDPMAGHLLLAAGTVAGLTLGLVGLRRRWPGALAAWVAFGVLIAPVSGLVPFGRLRGVADRYTYAACIGWALVAGAAWALAWEAPWVRRARGRRALVAACVVAVLFGWSAFAWSQARIWRDSVSLWRWTVAVVPDSPLAHYKLGWALAYAGELDTAEVHVRRAADAWPEHPEVLQNLARILARRGRLEEAAAVLRRAVAVAPRAAGLRADLGSVLEASGELDRAADELQGALRLDPGDWRAHEYLGRVRARQGREAEALVHRRRAAEQRGAVSPAADRDGGAPVPPEGEGPSAPW